MRYELSINILDKKYTDMLIIGLVRQGYSVYYNDEWEKSPCVCFSIDEGELTELPEMIRKGNNGQFAI